MNIIPIKPAPRADLTWPAEGLTRVPYTVFQSKDVYADEQDNIFRGANWNFLCLEVELPNPGDFRSQIGRTAPSGGSPLPEK